MIRIKAIAFTGYPVTDIARAKSFYEQILRLTPTVQFECDGRHWIEYDIGPHTLAISNMAGEQWKPSSSGGAAALEVEDFDAAVAALREAGVRFTLEPVDSGVCRMAVVLDPDGNSLTIHRRNEG
jgi:predicted enzyme related to lactoylglutathione lyase